MTIHDLLLLCLQYRPDQQAPLGANKANVDWASVDWASVDWADVVAMAVAQGVAPLLYYRLRAWRAALHFPPALWQTLEGAYLQNRLRNHQLYQQLATLLTVFHTEQIAVIVLKGAHLATVVYENVALRTMTDLDLLVAPTALPPTIALLTRLGYRPLTPLAPLAAYFTHVHHLPRFVKPGAPSIEVHWTITRPNQGYTIPMTDLWTRAQPYQFGGVTALALCSEDLLLHVCLHATYQHQLEQGVRFLCDLDAIVRRFGPTLDWEQVVARAQAWQWARGVYLALHLTQELLAAPIPAHVLATLQPDGASALLPTDLQSAFVSHQMTQRRVYSRIFARMWHAERIQDKVRTVWQRIFLPRDLLAIKHGVAPSSPKLLWYYLLRLVDLLRRYGGTILLSRRQRTATDSGLKRKAQLAAWLENHSGKTQFSPASSTLSSKF